MDNLYRDLMVNGNGTQEIKVPASYGFVTVLNNTGYILNLYKDNNADLRNRVYKFPTYSNLTIPFSGGRNENVFLASWSGSGAEKITLVFSEKNLGFSQILSTASGFEIQADNVGLAKAVQLPAELSTGENLAVSLEETGFLPAALTAGGNLAVSLEETGFLPAALTAGGNFKTAIQEAGQLPAALTAGGNLKVSLEEVVALLTMAGKTAAKITAAGAEDKTVKVGAGKVWGIVGISTGVTVTLKDAASEKWYVKAETSEHFTAPITCATSIILTFSGAGDAFIIYE